MPCLRSQTRASFSDTSTDSDKFNSTKSSSSIKPITSNQKMSPIISTSKSMFPFPPAIKKSHNHNSNIINISNVSSEAASTCSETSSASNLASASNPSSPHPEKSYPHPNLNNAIIIDSKHSGSTNSIDLFGQDCQNSQVAPSFPSGKSASSSLPAMLQKSLMLSTTPM